jgi:hypothetical protein
MNGLIRKLSVNSFLASTVLGLLLAPSMACGGVLAPVDLSADVRLRLEQDWAGTTETGVKRPDRARIRIRDRLAARIDLGAGFSIASRVRTETSGSQQGANITFLDFDGNNVDVFNGGVDRYSIAWRGKAAGLEVGRMNFPFFTSTEYFWDADISPLGVAGNVAIPVSGGTTIRLNAGAFALPVGIAGYSGHLFGGQVTAEHGPALVAAGVFRFDADKTDPEGLNLLGGNGQRDYTVLAVNAQYRVRACGKPLTFSADLYRNLQQYRNDPDPVSRANADQRTGYALSATWGDTVKRGHWQLGYRLFHMERLAVNSSYANDDLARFGTSAQAALSDIEGYDLFANYAITDKLSVGVRTMLVQRISTVEEGKRARLDLTYNF